MRSGLGLGVVHRFIARRHQDLRPVLPERRATRAYWIVEHEDTQGLARIQAVHDFIVEAVQADRASFIEAADYTL